MKNVAAAIKAQSRGAVAAELSSEKLLKTQKRESHRRGPGKTSPRRLRWPCVGDTSPRKANAENTIPATNAMPVRTVRTTKTRTDAGSMLITFLA